MDLGMNSIAITDHGNMFGVKEFYNSAKDVVKKRKEKAKAKGLPYEDITFNPILGCEVYVAPGSRNDRERDENKRAYYHLILLAKNLTGYKNLIHLASKAYTDGYYHHPRIDKELLREHSEGLICSSACLGGDVPYAARNKELDEVVKLALEYKDIFGDDYYLELQRHQSGIPTIDADVYERQKKVNKVLQEVSKITGIKLIATNDVHFIKAEDAEAHDHLICLNTGKDLDDPNRMRYTTQEYLKSPDEMAKIFEDVPEAITNIQEIIGKIESFKLDVAPVMPNFPLPDGFTDPGEYLRHITYEGASKRWDVITPEIKERIDFELDTIIKMGFPGYFLIVWDFIREAREIDVAVGPGRGSAAGSAVAYSLKITEIDPIKYLLLFERFLNPDRISLPDIDIDFDEDGRERVIEYVVNKYGENSVAHVITFGTMATKSSIKDVARVQKLPLDEANRLCKLIPEKAKDFKDACKLEPKLEEEKKSENELIRNTLRNAEILEGSVRQVGIHACGIIICRDNLWDHIPISKNKEAKLLVTQFEGKFIEEVGMLKMDFLGLKTLSIIKDAVKFIKESKGIAIEIDKIPLNDTKTFDLYSKGETTALFQFESAGMKKYLCELKPNRFEDLIAMNALYRPGPLEYIPSFIKRKHGKEPIEYDVPDMEEFLQDTYGITVYQEQVMLLSQKLADFTKGDADTLRKAMGKKQIEVLNKMKSKFIDQAKAKGHPEEKLNKIWTDWEAFAQYAFNKSHSTCYAYVAYQTGYLKANYPAEFMAAVLSRNLSNIDKITIFMDECKRMGMKVLVPDVNESKIDFGVNNNDEIRFGLGAIKGVGEAASENIIAERKKNGPFVDVWDFMTRVNLKAVNKKCMENLIKAGAFDGFGIDRYRYFLEDNSGPFLETLIKFGQNMQSGSNAGPSLFDDVLDVQVSKPKFLEGDTPSALQTLNDERDLIGIYLSSHPLDEFRIEVNHFCRTHLSALAELDSLKGKELMVAGMVTAVRTGLTKTNKAFTIFKLEDFYGSFEFALFGKDNEEFNSFAIVGNRISIKGVVDFRFRGSDQLGFKIQTIEPLSELKKRIRKFTVRVNVRDIDEEMIETLYGFADEKIDNGIPLCFMVYHPAEKIWIEMESPNFKTTLSNELFEYIEQLRSADVEIDYRLN
jgi:DNA polymerase-3 subunit alpha